MPAAGWKRGISGEARACTAGNNRARQGASGDLVAASVDHSSTVLTESGGPFLVPSRTGYGICCDLRKEAKPVAHLLALTVACRGSSPAVRCARGRHAAVPAKCSVVSCVERDRGVRSADTGNPIGVGIMNRQLAAIIERDGTAYVSLCPELDIASQGSTTRRRSSSFSRLPPRLSSRRACMRTCM